MSAASFTEATWLGAPFLSAAQSLAASSPPPATAIVAVFFADVAIFLAAISVATVAVSVAVVPFMV